jgi:hypothetical protein
MCGWVVVYMRRSGRSPLLSLIIMSPSLSLSLSLFLYLSLSLSFSLFIFLSLSLSLSFPLSLSLYLSPSSFSLSHESRKRFFGSNSRFMVSLTTVFRTREFTTLDLRSSTSFAQGYQGLIYQFYKLFSS